VNLSFIGVGGIALLAGTGVLVTAIRSGTVGEDPRSTAMLIGGMMLATFGLLLVAFAIGLAGGEAPGAQTEASS
jgi:hypothetical protein